MVVGRAPSAHGCPRRPLRGGVRGGRIRRSRRCQMVSRISCCTVRASTRRNRWQATLACPLTRTCRAPYGSFRAEFTRPPPGAAGSGRGRGVCGPLSSAPAPLSRGAPPAPRRGGGLVSVTATRPVRQAWNPISREPWPRPSVGGSGPPAAPSFSTAGWRPGCRAATPRSGCS